MPKLIEKAVTWMKARLNGHPEGTPANDAPADWDPEIQAKCLPTLGLPDHQEDAIIRAFKILEGRLRDLLGASAEKTGTQLAEEAFGQGGPLQLGKTSGEQQGLLRLYSGAFLLNRNASGHRFIRYTSAEALQLIGFINLLLRWLDRGLEGTTRELGVLNKGEQAVRYILHDIDLDGEKERLVSIIQTDTDVYTCKLVYIDSTAKAFKSITLLEDEPGESLECQVRDINLDGKPEIIARSKCGERSERLHIWQWDTDHFRELTGGGIYSDYPRIELRDVDGDGKEEIIAYKRHPNLPSTAHQTTVATHHWNGHQYEAALKRIEGSPNYPETTEDRVKRLVVEYEPAAEAFVRAVNEHPGSHVSWWIDKVEQPGRDLWRVQLREWSDHTTLGQTFNHYKVDLGTRKVSSMFFHHPDGSLTSDQEW